MDSLDFYEGFTRGDIEVGQNYLWRVWVIVDKRISYRTAVEEIQAELFSKGYS